MYEEYYVELVAEHDELSDLVTDLVKTWDGDKSTLADVVDQMDSLKEFLDNH